MVAIGDHLRITAVQNVTGWDVHPTNVYYYKVTGLTGSPSLLEMGEAFYSWYFETFSVVIRGIQATAILHDRLTVESMENWSTEFLVLNALEPFPGNVSGGFSSLATAWSFQYNRVLRTTRNGAKRFGGVPESQVDNNVPIPAMETPLLNVRVALQQAWTVTDDDGGFGLTMTPVIAKTPVGPATRPSVYNDISSVSFQGVGSQNTRKRLR